MLQTKYWERKKEKLSLLAAYANYSISMWHDATLNNDLDINKVLLTEYESGPFSADLKRRASLGEAL